MGYVKKANDDFKGERAKDPVDETTLLDKTATAYTQKVSMNSETGEFSFEPQDLTMRCHTDLQINKRLSMRPWKLKE